MPSPPLSRRLLLGLGTAALTLAAPGVAQAFPDKPVDPRWLDHDEASGLAVDQGPWAAFLARYRVVGDDGIARLRYGDVTAADRDALDRHIAMLASNDVARLGRDEQFAFWANLYNALTVKVVLGAYPVASIRDIDAGLFSAGPWDEARIEVGGAALSLDDIEHGILRPLWRDPRLHYVLNCASLGCPDLPATPLAATGLEARLEGAARAYVNHPRGVAVLEGALVVSSIYAWYEEDFGDGQGAVIAHLRMYAEPPLGEVLAGFSEIGDDRYDWRLNDAGHFG